VLECIRTRLGRLKREVFLALLPNHAMFDALLAALCDSADPRSASSYCGSCHRVRALTASSHLQRMVMTRAAMNGLHPFLVELRLSLERVCALYL
jgi:hypothetical protein